MSEIQRWNLVARMDGGDDRDDVEKDGNGDWVEYADHLARIAALEAENAELRGSDDEEQYIVMEIGDEGEYVQYSNMMTRQKAIEFMHSTTEWRKQPHYVAKILTGSRRDKGGR